MLGRKCRHQQTNNEHRFTGGRSVIQKGLILGFAVGLSLTIFIACGDIKQTKTADITDSNKSQALNHDSLIKVVFKFAEPYFNTHSIANIIALKGRPQLISKKEWGESEMHQDSLVTVKYPLLVFNFLQSPYPYAGLQSLHLLDSNSTLAGNIKVGKTTRQDILQSLGIPNDSNDVGRLVTKSGGTTVYDKQPLAGDTVTFSYYINIDEYAIGFIMTKDTLREITWVKNMN